MKILTYKGEVFSYYITDEFDGNHILHATSSKRGELELWWGSYHPTPQKLSECYDRFRGKIGS